MVPNAWNRMLSVSTKWICRVLGHRFKYLKPWFICQRCGHHVHNTYPPQGTGASTAHADTHIRAASDPIIVALDGRAIGLTAQGEIAYHAAVANTLAALATGVAGQALLTGGAGADPSWGAPAPADHAAAHLDGAADEIDAADLAGTGGAAGEIIESDGAALSYVEPDGRYTPAAHVLATTGPHTNTLPLTDLEVGVRGNIIHRGAADWAALAVGAAGQSLLSGGAGADVSWGAPALPAAVPQARATAFETLLTGLGATTVATWTTTNDGLHHGVLVLTYFRVVTGATVVTLQIDYTNPAGVASTTTILLAVNEAIGDYTAASIFILCDPNTAVDVVYTAGVINRVYASSTILEAGVPE